MRLLPVFDEAFQKTLVDQTHIELVRMALALERYYLMNGNYPKSLEPLVPEYSEHPLRDPMNGKPWNYTREGKQGFHLYSVGMNGIDDGGKDSGDDGDDIAWRIRPEPPPLPVFEYNGKKLQGSFGNLDLERRKAH
jgi:hypothetical protein